MHNGRDHYSPGRGPNSYPTPAPSPEVDDEGVPLPPKRPRCHPVQLPQKTFIIPQPHLHPLLGYADCPCIVYDIREHPNAASAPHSRLEWAHESATNPPSLQIIITCQVLPHPFVVHPSGRNYDFVTVHDILEAVHSAFSEAIRAAEDHRNLISRSRRSGQDETATTLLLGGFPSGLSVLSERYTWKGLSEEISPGNWLLHIE